MRSLGAVALVAVAASSCGPSTAPHPPSPAGPVAAAPAGSLLIDAAPERLTTSRSARIRVTVLDAEGRPVPNTPVRFSVEPGANEFLDSAGHPIFTDANGRAEDVVRTLSSADAAPYVVTLKIQAGDVVQASVRIGVN